ncbi:MAG TPA: glycosyltransferase, partial [Bacteroidota bacterium]|nr:glycosyltransferase [Bacteroidota bacterium]
MADPRPFCSVVIVTYNGKDLLRPCLAAAIAQRYSPYEVILVDNASTDGSADLVRAEFPTVRLVR